MVKNLILLLLLTAPVLAQDLASGFRDREHLYVTTTGGAIETSTWYAVTASATIQLSSSAATALTGLGEYRYTLPVTTMQSLTVYARNAGTGALYSPVPIPEYTPATQSPDTLPVDSIKILGGARTGNDTAAQKAVVVLQSQSEFDLDADAWLVELKDSVVVHAYPDAFTAVGPYQLGDVWQAHLVADIPTNVTTYPLYLIADATDAQGNHISGAVDLNFVNAQLELTDQLTKTYYDASKEELSNLVFKAGAVQGTVNAFVALDEIERDRHGIYVPANRIIAEEYVLTNGDDTFSAYRVFDYEDLSSNRGRSTPIDTTFPLWAAAAGIPSASYTYAGEE
jgi:hypothetical protein